MTIERHWSRREAETKILRRGTPVSQLPRISVIVPTFRPGEGLDRVVRSLDAQTMPKDQFEVLFVDDGSGDETAARLHHIAAERPNVRVEELENSGWPSRPRNVGVELARGEYVLFMDHDDSLFPDGLRRAYEYAEQTGADLLSPKESKTNDVWWGLSPESSGNIAGLDTATGIGQIIPMVPHKLYRRSLLKEHRIRFPEGSRVLWEDWYINLGAYRHADVVSVLADTPVYLWHASDQNASHTFDPTREDYWERLDQVLAFAVATLDRDQDRAALHTVLAHNLRLRVIERCIRVSARSGTASRTKHMVLKNAQELLARYGNEDVIARMPRQHQAQAVLLGAGRTDLMAALHASDLSMIVEATARSLRWDGPLLRYDTELRWKPKSPGRPGLRAQDGRVVRQVSHALEEAIPAELLDVTDATGLGFRVAIRDRLGHVTWPLPLKTWDTSYVVDGDGSLTLVQRGCGAVCLQEAAAGRPLPRSVWDVRVRSTWDGMVRKGALSYRAGPLPMVSSGQSAVAYANASGGLSIDLMGRTRTLVTDAVPRAGYVGQVSDFSTPLENIAAFDNEEIPVDDIFAIAEHAIPVNATAKRRAEMREDQAISSALTGRIVVEERRAYFRGGADLPAGHYTLYARRNGVLCRTRCGLRVDHTGHAHFESGS